MFSEDLKAINAATQTATAQPRPVNPLFISISELLERVQTAPAKHLPLIDAAKLLTMWGKAQADKPEWRCNSKTRGIVRVDATQATWATDRLEYVASRGHFESDGGNGASTDYELFGFDRKEFSDFLVLKAGTSIDLFGPMPDTTPATDTATPAPVVADEIAFDRLATRQQLIGAFGKFTGMSMAWFVNLNDSPKLKAARKYTGQGGRHSAEPLFCPYEVMQWLTDPKLKKCNTLNNTTAWRLLKGHFPKAYILHSIGDPNAD